MGAGIHRSKIVKEKIDFLFPDRIQDFPRYSLDLNPIELLWCIVEKELRKKTYSNLEDMAKDMLDIWNRIPISLCRTLIDTFNKRIMFINKNKGMQYYNTKDNIKTYNSENRIKFTELWNNVTGIERIVISTKTFLKMKKGIYNKIKMKIGSLNKELNSYCKHNFKTTKKDSICKRLKYKELEEDYRNDFTASKITPLRIKQDSIETINSNDLFTQIPIQFILKSIGFRPQMPYRSFYRAYDLSTMMDSDTDEDEESLV